ncbi:hypothetical protein LGV61_07905 [Desulfurispirillum indicum]|uniref:Methyl-accepting chemotaxis sensory transducer n=1 Tax=Desulfurispirillum indicum (strain ATCC BAA-1389 / DSM 22839 / S5) TaxID=653733 RepID=E6W0A3_DESIS|nr:hypothetical protein [Desulfurispirillum indicum]ADU66321.1 methyl-accepting chemotaxis sensory transducer [Desulfurispirillum indicum S5]UCZ55654.1 hypothetical protein LGV61_07905 [Desulfurispirillum indicum]
MTPSQLQQAYSELDPQQQVECLKAIMPQALEMMRTSPLVALEIFAACQEQMAGMDMSQLMAMMSMLGKKEDGCCSSGTCC